MYAYIVRLIMIVTMIVAIGIITVRFFFVRIAFAEFTTTCACRGRGSMSNGM